MTVRTVEHRMWGIGIAADEGFALPASDLRWLLKRCELLQAVVTALPGAIESEDWSDLYAALDALAEWERGDGKVEP